MSAPSVYRAITAVTFDLHDPGIAKTHLNSADDYYYRSIDDVLEALAPLLPKHRLCVLPTVLDRIVTERREKEGSLLLNVALHVAFDLVSSEDGSCHRVEAFGEALDPSDKATAKAMSAAYKTAMLQTFCIPVGPSGDPDGVSHKLEARTHLKEPDQGWEQWGADIGGIVALCESHQAIDLVQDRNRDLLKAMSRERPDLYAKLGQTFEARRNFLRSREQNPVTPSRKRSRAPVSESRREVGRANG